MHNKNIYFAADCRIMVLKLCGSIKAPLTELTWQSPDWLLLSSSAIAAVLTQTPKMLTPGAGQIERYAELFCFIIHLRLDVLFPLDYGRLSVSCRIMAVKVA